MPQIVVPTPCTHSPYRQAISYSQASDPGIVLDGGRNLMKEQGAAKVMIATCSRQWTSNLNKREVNWAKSAWQRLMGLLGTGEGGGGGIGRIAVRHVTGNDPMSLCGVPVPFSFVKWQIN